MPLSVIFAESKTRPFEKFVAGVFLLANVALAITVQRFDMLHLDWFLSSIPYRCPLKLFTGLECAFCGMTHSWLALLKGEFFQSFHFNVLGPIVWFISIGWAAAVLLGFDSSRLRKPWVVSSTLAFFVTFAIARNFLK